MILPQQQSYLKTIQHLLILLVCCLLAYWPLTFHLYSLKNDALNYFLPVRHLISEQISHGYWPLWTPYLNLGYPLHGDMQSGVWNPFVQLLSLSGPYTLRTLQLETIFYIYTSGMGMYFLVHHFTSNRRVALLIGASFMLCGYNVDSTQFLNWISAASFLPFVFLFYYRMLMERTWPNAVICALFLYLLFATAYPADFILTAYLLFFVFVWHLFRKENRKKFLNLLMLHLLLIIGFCLLTLPAIISYAEFLQLSQRGSGATYEQAMSNPLHPILLISYITPLPVFKASFAAITDPLTRNSYVGLMPFAFFISSFFIRNKKGLYTFLKIAFIISLLFSFGELGGIRILSYYIFPLMDSFRHPSNARLFSIFFACLVAGLTLKQMTDQPSIQKHIRSSWYIISGSMLILLVWSITGSNGILASISGDGGYKSLLDRLNFHDLLFLNIIIQIPFLIALYFLAVKKFQLKKLVVLSMVNSVLIIFLYQPFPVVKKDSALFIQHILDEIQTGGYPAPDLNATVYENSKNGMAYFKEIGVSNLYNKKIGRVDYRITPSNLNYQNEFWYNDQLRNHMIHYPLLYKADIILNITDTARANMNGKKVLFLDHLPDSAYSNDASYSAILKEFTPLQFNMIIESAEPGYYCLFQNYYPRWQLKVDGVEQPPVICNVSFLGFSLPAGRHKVELEYKSNDIRTYFYVSLVSLFIILLSVSIYFIRNRNISAFE